MTTTQWDRIQRLFEEATGRDPRERDAFLADACGSDFELRSEVESLLAADTEPKGFLDEPPVAALHDVPDAEAATRMVGKRVGRYHIRGVIASGGMGVVYEAVQETPNRTVALKVMKRGIASRSAMRRFQDEAQIMGRLRHPGIGQIYEGGIHNDEEGSVPYFAMEYIPATKNIVEYANCRDLGIKERLELFGRVCDAINHGHVKGVIHRDLKPSNILVDSSVQPKVIDFGIARATDADLAVTTLQTHIGQLIGTVQYMSPEQTEGDPHNLDFRSDIYSLGVLLFELLTGELPYAASRLNIIQATRLVREEIPRRLSSIKPKLRGDVETIVSKALEKDRERRYQSAAEFGNDIQRYLRGEPILARRPTAMYQLGFFARRHRLFFTAATASVAALLVGVIATSIAWRRAQRAESQQRHRVEMVAYGSKLGAAEAALQMNDPGNAQKILSTADEDLRGWEWRHLESRVDQSIFTLGYGDSRIGIDVDRSGRLLVVQFVNEDVVDLYDISSRTKLSQLPYPGNVTAAAVSSDGHLLACSFNKENDNSPRYVGVWDLSVVAEPTWVSEWLACDGEHGISGLAFHPNRPLLASSNHRSDSDYEIKLWDLSDLEEYRTFKEAHVVPESLATLSGHAGDITSLVFSPDGAWLASSSMDYTARVWDVEKALTEGSMNTSALCEHSYFVLCVAFSPDSRRLASASVDKTVRLWDVESVKAREYPVLIKTIDIFEDSLKTVAFDSTGARLLLGGRNGIVHVWDDPSGSLPNDPLRPRTWTLRGHEGPIRHLAALPSGEMISASDDGTVKFWMPDTLDIARLRGHISSVQSVLFAAADRCFVSSSPGDDTAFIVWDTDLCIPVSKQFLQHKEGIRQVRYWSDEREALVAAATYYGSDALYPRGSGRLILWNIDDTGAPRRLCAFHPSECTNCDWSSLAFSDNGKRLATGDRSGTVFVWDIADRSNPELRNRFKDHADPVSSVVFLDKEAYWLASGCGYAWNDKPSEEQCVHIRDLNSDRETQRIPDHGEAVTCLSLDLARRQLASADRDGTVRLWSVNWKAGPSLEPKHILEGHTARVNSVAFHPDLTRPRLASSSDDGTIRIWDAQIGVELGTLRTRTKVMDVAFDSSGDRLVSAAGGFEGSDNVVMLWETGATPELRRRRAILKRAYDEVLNLTQRTGLSVNEAKTKLQSDPRLPREVQDDAVEYFERLLPHPGPLVAKQVQPILENDNVSRDDLERAMEWARLACKVAPENIYFVDLVLQLNTRLSDDPGLDALEILRQAIAMVPPGHSPVREQLKGRLNCAEWMVSLPRDSRRKTVFLLCWALTMGGI